MPAGEGDKPHAGISKDKNKESSDDAEKVSKMRNILLQSLAEALPADCILLSGGLDTCILAEAAAQAVALRKGDNKTADDDDEAASRPYKEALTAIAGAHATDLPFAAAIAKLCGIPHTIMGGPETTPAALVERELEFVVRTLRTFDPMEVRNSISVAVVLREARDHSHTSAVTGDGADELFAGYSFTHAMDEQKLSDYQQHLINVMHFAAVPLGRELGIEVRQPYLHPDVIAFAQTLSKADLIGSQDSGGPGEAGEEEPPPQITHGKLILRRAFPEVHSAWRRKDPIEVGSGTTVLPAYYASLTTPEDFEREKAEVWAKSKVRLRDPEQLHYFRVFNKVFGGDTPPGMTRWGSDPCIACGYQLTMPSQTFCVVCGEFPAREKSG